MASCRNEVSNTDLLSRNTAELLGGRGGVLCHGISWEFNFRTMRRHSAIYYEKNEDLSGCARCTFLQEFAGRLREVTSLLI